MSTSQLISGSLKSPQISRCGGLASTADSADDTSIATDFRVGRGRVPDDVVVTTDGYHAGDAGSRPRDGILYESFIQ